MRISVGARRFAPAGGPVRQRIDIAKLLSSAGVPLTAALVACNLIAGLLPVGFAYGMGSMIGRIPAVVAQGAHSAAWGSLTVIFALGAVALVIQQVLSPVQAAVGELLARRIDEVVIQRLMSTSLRTAGIAPLEDQTVLDRLGEASRELEFPVQSPGKACAGLVALIARYVQLLAYVVIVGAAYSWLAAVALLAVTLIFRYGQRGGLRRYAKVYDKLASVLRSSFYHLRLALLSQAAMEIRIFGLIDWLQQRYRTSYMAWLMPAWSMRRAVYLRPFLGYAALGLLLYTAVFWPLGGSLADRSLTLGAFALTLQSAVAAQALASFYPEADTQTQLGMNSFDAVRGFERTLADYTPPYPLPRHEETGQADPAPAHFITFSAVTFRYPGQRSAVFDTLDLKVPIGSTLAVVGANGAGKTTLVKLLTRLYEPDSGRILADGIDVRDMELDTWRRKIAVVFQDFLRFEASAAANIGFGAADHLLDLDGIRGAADAAGIGDFLDRLPLGYETPLAAQLTGGVNLSGGQWQRVALARALFAARHGANILVLDEPTANLDIRAEARFFAEFSAIAQGLTTILISHRFSTVRHADAIAVLANGQVAEFGSHEELMQRRGRYSEMFLLQASQAIDGNGRPDTAMPTHHREERT